MRTRQQLDQELMRETLVEKCVLIILCDYIKHTNGTKEAHEDLLDCIRQIKLEMWMDGYEQACLDFGVWRHGVQVIGCLETPVKEVIAKLRGKK